MDAFEAIDVHHRWKKRDEDSTCITRVRYAPTNLAHCLFKEKKKQNERSFTHPRKMTEHTVNARASKLFRDDRGLVGPRLYLKADV